MPFFHRIIVTLYQEVILYNIVFTHIIERKLKVVIEESNEGGKYIKPPGILLSFLLTGEGLITYIYPLLL
jgi:hypothetical protein